MARWIDRNAESPKAALQRWVAVQVVTFRSLCGLSVARWVGDEMAMREVGPSGAPQFHDPAIPYLQVCPLYVEFVGGSCKEILTYQNLWPDGWGLYLDPLYDGLPDACSEPGSIFRTRELHELPTGSIDDVRVVQDNKGDIVEVRLNVHGNCVTLWSGEVYEEIDGSLRIVRPDEHVLIAVNQP